MPSFYEKHGGFILAVAIDKYMFVNVNTPIVTTKFRVRYSKSEIVDRVDELNTRLPARRCGILRSLVESSSFPSLTSAGTGLGSSSSYLVGLLNAMHALMQRQVSPQILAEEACHIELDILKKPIGKQDQYMAAFGGVRRFSTLPQTVPSKLTV